MTMESRVNSVKYLQSIIFSQLTFNEKIEIKAKGRPTPMLCIQQKSVSRSKEYVRQFKINIYEKCEWLCGCEEENSLFCFPCLLFGGDPSWTKNGVTDLRHLPQKLMKHEQSGKHINNVIDFIMLGTVNIAAQTDSAFKPSIAKHSEEVKANRNVLSKIINCVKFCGKYELLPRGQDETMNSKNPGVLRGIVDFACGLDSSLDAHIRNVTAFKGTSKSIQNELLESMLVISKNKIKEEVKKAEYLAVMCEETTDVYDKTQVILVLRYELQRKPVERFWGIFNLPKQTPEGLASVLLRELQILIGDSSHKLIAQTYDGAAARSGVNEGVQTIVKEMYTNAHFIHCYAHHLSLIFEQATSQNTSVRVFFNSLSGIPTFFSKSAQRMAALKNITAHRFPAPSAIRWNFKSRTVNAVHEMKDELTECCNILEASDSRDTGYAAAGIKRILSDPEFEFWLEFFSKIMPHVDIMFSQFQSRNIDAAKANACLEAFTYAVQKLRDECEAFVLSHENKRRKFDTDRSVAAKEVCDIILLECKTRFSFTDHLEASKLLLVNNFPRYTREFPGNALAQTVAAYPMLEKEKLRTELAVLYTREHLCKSENLIDLLEIIDNNNFQSTFSETVKLIKILITTPMITAKTERHCSTLERTKTFLCSTMMNERLSALAMISIENTMITEMKDFNEQVINHFATSKNRHIDFIGYSMYKNIDGSTPPCSASRTPAGPLSIASVSSEAFSPVQSPGLSSTGSSEHELLLDKDMDLKLEIKEEVVDDALREFVKVLDHVEEPPDPKEDDVDVVASTSASSSNIEFVDMIPHQMEIPSDPKEDPVDVLAVTKPSSIPSTSSVLLKKAGPAPLRVEDVDEFQLFGMFVASQLRALPLRDALQAQLEIQTLLAQKRSQRLT